MLIGGGVTGRESKWDREDTHMITWSMKQYADWLQGWWQFSMKVDTIVTNVLNKLHMYMGNNLQFNA